MSLSFKSRLFGHVPHICIQILPHNSVKGLTKLLYLLTSAADVRPSCGSHLFYRLKESKQYMIPAGLFDEQDSFVFENQVFIDKKPSFYSFANKTNDMTEAEIFDMYGSS